MTLYKQKVGYFHFQWIVFRMFYKYAIDSFANVRYQEFVDFFI